MSAKRKNATVTGWQSRAAGQLWEGIIERSCDYYRRRGMAEIEKTPEPMKPIKPLGQGRFIAYYEKRAQPDYKGTLNGGGSVVFEAKHTDADRLKRSAVTEEQEKCLDRHALLGAECFVMVSFGFEKFFKVPWEIFRDMKERFGRRYITPEDVKEYEVRYEEGVIKFL